MPAGLSNVVAIGAGESHSLALKRDGTLLAWGDNSFGQTNVPTGLSNVLAIAAGPGANHSMALKRLHRGRRRVSMAWIRRMLRQG